MGQAKNIAEIIMQEKSNYPEWGLSFEKKAAKCEEFNLLVGENGSGKSRILQMIREKAKGKCNIIYMDFAHYIQKTSTERTDTDADALVQMLMFRDEEEGDIFLDFLNNLDSQILSLIDELFDMEKSVNRHLQKRAHKIMEALEPRIEDILHRKISVKEDGIYLCKNDREVTLMSEWLLLSPGERSILIIIFAVLFIELEKRPCILLIDEIETHLHPDAQVKICKLLKEILNNSVVDHCTFIASHSIFLLPLFDIHELLYMNNGRIQTLNSGLYQQIYDNLTGEGENGQKTLTDFMYSMSAWQYADYLAQCFMEPTTVDEVSDDDEQALKFVEVLKDLRRQNKTIQVLDFGAGDARIGGCIELMLKSNDDVIRLAGELKYHIYDNHCITEGFVENSGWKGKAFGSEDEIRSCGIKFDMILLYNVLHEIGVDEWERELSFMLDLLTEDGILLFGEREWLSVGEKPYGKSGYLVLGREELLKLFPGSEIKEISLSEREKNVTFCFAVKKPKEKKGYPSSETVKAALQLLRYNTKNKIRNRDNNGLGKRGKSRKYAFYCQQYVNAEEAIEIMEGEEIKEIQAEKNWEEKIEEQKSQPSWLNEHTTLADIIQSNLSFSHKIKKMKELALLDTEEGRKSRKYLEENKIE